MGPENVFLLMATVIIVSGAILFTMAFRRLRVLRHRRTAGEDVSVDMAATLYILLLSGGFAALALLGVLWVIAKR
jgi:hypothetical protein